ncbi:MAG TPA: M28 family peptidase [Candidatus Ozemobacteraceae bacterium]|nr:M28 family peptidase [Candidatus Ozemobacteraceae bacterium]
MIRRTTSLLAGALFAVVLGCSNAGAAEPESRWAISLPVETAKSVISKSDDAQLAWTTIGANTVVICRGRLAESIVRRHPEVPATPFRPGEEAWLLATKDPALRGKVFPGVRTLLRRQGYHVVLANETARMGISRWLSDFTRIDPLPADTVVLTPPSRPGRSRPSAEDPIGAFVDRIDREAFAADLKALADLQTRSTYSAGGAKALAYVERSLTAMGLQVRRQAFGSAGAPSANIEAVQPGFDPANAGEVIILGHLDSTSPKASTLAPGADDNGSGAAGVLALARLMQGRKGRASVRYVLVMGEEQGLLGSKAYVAALPPAELANLRAVINMDMIGFDAKAPLSMVLETAAFNREMAERMAELAAAHTTLSTQISTNPWGSDHVPFLKKQVPTVLTIESEYDDNPTYHQVTDTFEKVNLDLAWQILRLNAAMLAEAASVERLARE